MASLFLRKWRLGGLVGIVASGAASLVFGVISASMGKEPDANGYAAYSIVAGAIALGLLAVIAPVRVLPVSKPDQQLQQEERTIASDSSLVGIAAFGVEIIAYALLYIGIPLGILYGLVRFVKWAWMN